MTMKLTLTGALLTSGLALFNSSAHAFNSLSHEQITRAAIAYLNTHPHVFNETDRWLSGLGKSESFMTETLVRGAVDADFRSDVWLTGWFHGPLTGASASAGFTLFTSMTHYLNVSTRGDYWDYDGYAYRHGSHANNDEYLNTLSTRVVGTASKALGGVQPLLPEHGASLPIYDMGFKGNARDWQNMFFGMNMASKAVFPPANVPAQLAYNALMASGRATEDRAESWTQRLPLVSGVFTTKYLDRHFWRGEIKSLPKAFDLLGLTLHMTQDLAIPQHTQGTADWCHTDLEKLFDKLICKTDVDTNETTYQNGSFGGEHLECNHLYDERDVGDILMELPALNPNLNISIGDRLKAIAKHSSRWHWGEPADSIDFVGTRFPNGIEATGNTCKDVLGDPEIYHWAKYQYNLAIASSVVMFELAAHNYESISEKINLKTFNLLDLFKGFFSR